MPQAGCGADLDCPAGQVCGSLASCEESCVTAGCPPGEVCRTDGHCRNPNAGGAPSCGGELFQVSRVQANMLIVLDRSGSMMSEAGGAPKWTSAVNAVRSVTSQHDAEIRFGLMMFPGTSSCSGPSYPVTVGDARAAEISAALPATATGSGTPIAAALTAASNAPELVDATRASYVLLVTDGKENCGGRPGQVVQSMFAQGIKTYVVGFGDEVDANMLSAMAVAGGTARAGTPSYYQADDSASLLSAMSAIAAGASGCDFKLAQAPPDPSRIYLYIDGQQAARDSNKVNGWEYNSATGRVTLYGPTCSAVSANPAAKVQIVYGCPDDSLVEGGPGQGMFDAGTVVDDGGISFN